MVTEYKHKEKKNSGSVFCVILFIIHFEILYRQKQIFFEKQTSHDILCIRVSIREFHDLIKKNVNISLFLCESFKPCRGFILCEILCTLSILIINNTTYG
jgi:hypothetical protein